MRRLALLSSFVLLNGGCAGLLGLDDFAEGETSAGGASATPGAPGSSVTGDAASSGGDPTSSSTEGAGGDGDGGAGGTGGTGGTGPLDVTPNGTVKLGILRSRQFAAAADVTWEVDEADGGSIDENGFYISPEEPGEYHVTATSVADPAVSETVTLTVVGLKLETFAGQPGGAGTIDGTRTRSRLNRPGGLATIDNDSVLLIADRFNHTIRAYDIERDEMRTVAGAPLQEGAADGTGDVARFNRPGAIAASLSGSQTWIADQGNHCIRSLNIATALVGTLAGSCGVPGTVDAGNGAASRFSNLTQMVLGPSNDFLYVCAESPRVIRRVDVSSGATSTVVTGMTNCAIEVDNYNEKIIYDDGSGTLKWFDDDAVFDSGSIEDLVALPTGVTSVSWISSDAEHGAGAYLVGSDHAVWHLDIQSREFDPAPLIAGEEGYVDGLVGDARFTTVTGFIKQPGRDYLFFSTPEETIRRVSLEEGAEEVETFIGARENTEPVDGGASTARFVLPFGVAVGADGDIFVSSLLGERGHDASIRRIEADSGEVVRFAGDFEPAVPVDGAADDARFGLIAAMVRVDQDIYVIDMPAHAIRKVSAVDGSVDTIAGELGQSGFADGIGAQARFNFEGIAGLTTDGTDLYVVDGGNFAIRRVELATGEVTTLAGGTQGTANGTGTAAQFMQPAGIAVVDGIAYVADFQDNVIRAVDLVTHEVTTLIGFSGVSGNQDGNASVATLSAPFSLVADGIGSLYVSSFGEEDGTGIVLRRLDLDGVQLSRFLGALDTQGFIPGPLPGTIGCAGGLAIDGAGDLLVSDFCDGAIGVVRPL